MKKQTAVEYLIEQIHNDAFVQSKSVPEWYEIFEKALAMEHEQIKLAINESNTNL